MSWSNSCRISKPFSSAFTLTKFIRSSTKVSNLYSSEWISIFPDSILEISKTSLIRDINVSPARSMFFAYSTISSSLLSRRIISFIPSTAFIGVRISWDILAKKTLFTSARCSASSFFISTRRSISIEVCRFSRMILRFFSSVPKMQDKIKLPPSTPPAATTEYITLTLSPKPTFQ